MQKYIFENQHKCPTNDKSEKQEEKAKFMTSKLKKQLDDIRETGKIEENISENEYLIIKRKIDEWLMFDIKNSPRDDMKLAFIEALE